MSKFALALAWDSSLRKPLYSSLSLVSLRLLQAVEHAEESG